MTIAREDFDGYTYSPRLDYKRLKSQLERVRWALTHSNQWWSLEELVTCCGGTTASISARLRDLRKPKFGGHTVLRQRSVLPGIWYYKLRLDPEQRELL